MKINDEIKLKFADERKLKETPATISQYEVLKLIAHRFKDVKPLFPTISRMGREFAASIKPASILLK